MCRGENDSAFPIVPSPATMRSAQLSRRKVECSDLRRETSITIGIGIVFSFFAGGYLCWALFDLVVYALPAIVGAAAGFAPDQSGAGVLGAIFVTLITGAFTLAAGHVAIERARSARVRTAIALLFTVPAAFVGYMLTLGVAQLGVPSVVWQQAFALFGAVGVGVTAWERVMHPVPPDSE
jgi:hypothetical protein